MGGFGRSAGGLRLRSGVTCTSEPSRSTGRSSTVQPRRRHRILNRHGDRRDRRRAPGDRVRTVIIWSSDLRVADVPGWLGRAAMSVVRFVIQLTHDPRRTASLRVMPVASSSARPRRAPSSRRTEIRSLAFVDGADRSDLDLDLDLGTRRIVSPRDRHRGHTDACPRRADWRGRCHETRRLSQPPHRRGAMGC